MGIANLSFIEGDTPCIAVIRADSCAADKRRKAEQKNFAMFSSATATAFERVGMPVVEVSDLELDAEVLADMKLVVFPYNPSLPEGKAKIEALLAERA